MMRKLGDVMPPASSPVRRERVRIIVVAIRRPQGERSE